MRPLTKFYFLLVFFGLLQTDLFAQSVRTIKGVIREKESGQVIPFATIKLKGVNQGTIADEMGEFSLNVGEQESESTLIVRCLGYQALEIDVSSLSSEENNQIELAREAIDLGAVLVSDDNKLKPKDLLKEVISRIPINYRTESFTYDAYYRERVTENGLDIRFVDAAVTFTQKGYSGKPSKSKAGYWSIVPLGNSAEGIMMGSVDDFYEEVYANNRFHDHFGHIPTTDNTVLIHESRRNIDQSKHGVLANSEGGPLSTLDKDLILDLDLFLRKSHFGKYIYDLLEVPNEEGDWDYLINFRPKRPALSVAKVASMRTSNKRIMRSDILSGSIRIDKESLAVKSISLGVENDFRRHICSFKSQALKHFGYQVNIVYKENDGKWQVDKVSRKHEFIFIDEELNTTTPYSSIAEITVTEPISEISNVPLSKSFVNVWTNVLFDYNQHYNASFWEGYEKKYPVAKISDPIRSNLSMETSLESQFQLAAGTKN
ncbi:carboxypeptidase-like regulatory domain-containing protein [Roseivirga misakiensis]|uniref:Carboxypeptidase-like regulatory domain-containing protein n=1 Tax=Roseivirga misakiensis TaxID=1563681 RepID=A0A1E5T3C0_9BACT|nr:carboxypeptidase-like regulatory domain-containing protein [Roseivirga misakiensis]OEK05870.1 hypothetical protein BFP71_07060 [Roseivirga misakiensis]